ncbi:MAG TPA: helix-turn-helix domain-containing protein [Methylocella sp.]|nr:helix-turn-helix domain-containing protein [Methylocella sp.]
MQLEIEPMPKISLVTLVARRKEIRARIWGPLPPLPSPRPSRPRPCHRTCEPPPRVEQPCPDGPLKSDSIAASPEKPPPRPVTIRAIIAETAAFYRVSPADILSRSRKQTFIKPRHIACYLAKSLTKNSLPEIGRRIGGRDHSTIFHAIRKIKGRMAADETLAAEIETIRERFIPPPEEPAIAEGPSDTSEMDRDAEHASHSDAIDMPG